MPTAPIALTLCHDCGHLFNQKYEAIPYGDEYDSSLHFSGVFQNYADDLVEMLMQRYSLRGKKIVEIGCGRGEFLRILCSKGANCGIGFDPSYPAEMPSQIDAGISFQRETFPSYHHDRIGADFVCCRQVLEHIADPRTFISALAESVGTGRRIPVFFEVPNSLYTLRDGGIWDIIYEHHSYFSPSSLARLFWECDFEPVEVKEAYSGQFVTIHALSARRSSTSSVLWSQALERLVAKFSETYHAKLQFWREQIKALETNQARIVAWGAGSKTTTFLNVLRPLSIDYVVDINPRKQGNFIVGTGQQIVAPEFLKDYEPHVVILTNGCYSSEVGQTLSSLGLSPELLLA